MPITVGNGTLVSFNAQFDSGVIDAKVVYALSNSTQQPVNHAGIPIASVQSYALQQGRSTWTPQDVCDVIAAGNAGFAPNTISPKS